jgi:hypothetical protein
MTAPTDWASLHADEDATDRRIIEQSRRGEPFEAPVCPVCLARFDTTAELVGHLYRRANIEGVPK